MKNTNLKRLIALLLCGVLTVGSLPAVFAEGTEGAPEYTEQGDFTEPASEDTQPAAAQPESTGMSQDEKNAVIYRLSGLVFPMESKYYTNIIDYAGCCGSGSADVLYGNVNYSCQKGHSSSNPNDGLDIQAEFGAALFAPAAGKVYFAQDRLVVEQDLNNGYSNYFILEGALAMVADGTYVSAGQQIGTAGSGYIHYLAVTAGANQGSVIAWNNAGTLDAIRRHWAVQSAGEGLLCINPGYSAEAQGSNVTAGLSGPSYSFPTAPAPETQPTEPETQPTEPWTEPQTWPTEPQTQPTDPWTQPTEPQTWPTEPQTQPTAPAHTEHVWDMGYDQIPATHMTTGVRVYTCAVCGQTREETIPNTSDHVFDQMIPSDAYLVRAATPTSAAVYFYSCACGQAGFETFEYGSPSACVEHVWDGGIPITQPTHTSEGLTEYTCTVCGQKKQEPTPKTAEHVFDQKVPADIYLARAATPTSPAQYFYSCVCGQTGYETFEYGSPSECIDHVWDGGVYLNWPTHTEDGLIEYTCTICGQKKQETAPKTAEHTFNVQNVSDAYLKEAANCSHPAIYYYACICGEKGTETYESGTRTDHTYSEAWSHNDIYHWHEATCGHTTEVSGQAAHTWDNGRVTKEAGHMTDGEMLYTCTTCGVTRTERINGQTHAYDQERAEDRYLVSAATCESPAVYYKSCVCGEKGTETFKYGEALGHKFAEAWSFDANQHWRAAICEHKDLRNQVGPHIWGPGEITVQPTSTTAGVRTYTCMCGATRTETVEPTQHQHTYSDTWNGDQYSHWHSPTCGDTTDVKDYALHVWNGGIDTWEWTNGIQHQKRVYTCQVCQRTREEVIHNYNQQIASAAYLRSNATCTTPATYYKSCACGEKGTETFTYGTATGHQYSGSWNSDSNYHWHTCTYCGTRGEIAQHSYNPSSEKCITCGYTSSSAHVHSSHLTRVMRKEATCLAPGNIAYFTCTCGKWFADSSAAQEIVDHNAVAIPAVGHVDKNNDGRCDVCREQIAKSNIEYAMTEGAGSTWINNSTTGLVFRTNADFSKFDHVEVDSKTVSGFNYTVSAGSTIVQLNAEYLKQLTTGPHTIAIVSLDGRADAAFTVKQAAAEKTGSGVWVVILVIAVIMILAAIGVAAYMFISGNASSGRPRKKKGGKFAK